MFDILPIEVVMRIVRFAQHVSKPRVGDGALNLLRTSGPIAEAEMEEFSKWTEEPDNKKERARRVAESRISNFEEAEGLQLSTRLLADYEPLDAIAKLLGNQMSELKLKRVKATMTYVYLVQEKFQNVRRLLLEGIC